jgi:hypothetical protein
MNKDKKIEIEVPVGYKFVQEGNTCYFQRVEKIPASNNSYGFSFKNFSAFSLVSKDIAIKPAGFHVCSAGFLVSVFNR